MLFDKITNLVKNFYVWQTKYFLGEEFVKFKSNKSKKKLIEIFSTKVDKAILTFIIPKLHSKNEFYGSFDGEKIIIKRRLNFFLRQMISIPYLYKASIDENNNVSFINGKYKMYLFVKVLLLFWINFFFGFFILFFTVTVKDLSYFLISKVNFDNVLNDLNILLFALLPFFCGSILIMFFRWTGKHNLMKMNIFLESLNLKRIS